MNKKTTKHDFVCVGFTRCGTTTLYEILKQHPKVYLPVIKEPYFYHIPSPPSEIWRKEKLHERGYDWFMKRYYPAKVPVDTVVGEISPSIVVSTNPRRLAKDYGTDIKIIFLLRNPVERLYSHFKYSNVNCLKGDKRLSNRKAFYNMVKYNVPRKSDDGIKNGQYYTMIRTGNYSEIINEYLKYFPQENIKYILFEDLIQQPEKVLEDLYEFLGLTKVEGIKYDIKTNDSMKVGTTIGSFWVRLRYDYYLRYVIKYLPFVNETFTQIVVRGIPLPRFLKEKKEIVDKTYMSEGTRKYLEHYYRADKKKVEQMIGRNLDDIWFR